MLFKKIVQKEEGGKVAYDYSKLRGKIVQKFGTQKNFAMAMGWSERTLSLKLNGFVFWKQHEISKALELLNIEESSINEYFFTQIVQLN